MNFLLILFLVITHQNIVSGDGEFSKVVRLLDYAETEIKEIQLTASTLMDNVANQLKKIVNDMQAESLSYINEGIQKLQQSSNDDARDQTEKYLEINKQLYDCSKVLNATVDDTITKFIEVIDESERLIEALVKELEKKPSSFDIDDIDDEIEDILGDFKEKFEALIKERVELTLRHARTNSHSIPPDVKKCVRDLVNKRI